MFSYSKKKNNITKHLITQMSMKKTLNLSFLMCAIMLCFSLSIQAQTKGKKINLTVNNEVLTTALGQIERQSGYYKINYSYEELSKLKVSAVIKGKYAPEAVQMLLAQLPYTTSVDGRFIQVKKSVSPRKNTQTSNGKGLSGQICDENGDPLIGATVQVVGTSKGTITDTDGNFYIADANAGDQIEVSYVGKKTIRQKAGNKKMNIIISDDQKLMDDVVVTGYQRISRESSTGSVAAVGTAKLEERYAPDIMTALEGHLPGLVNYSSGVNGEDNTITIRGISSLSATTKPLIVVDGLPISGSMDDVNMQDIASVTILKDAAATAIYGAQASNGVIVIETKRAKTGRVDVDFTADVTINAKRNYDDLRYMNANEQVDFESQLYNNYLNNSTASNRNKILNVYKSSPYQLTPIGQLYAQNALGTISDDQLQSSLSTLRNNDFVQQYRDNCEVNKLVQRYNVAIRSGSEKAHNSIVLNYTGDNGNLVGNYNKNLNVTYNGIFDFTKWFTLTVGANVKTTWSKSNNQTEATTPYNVYPYSTLYEADGSNSVYSLKNGPVALINGQSTLKSIAFNHYDELVNEYTTGKRVSGRYFVHGDFKIWDGLKASAQYQYEDISYDATSNHDADSYLCRMGYNVYTSGGTHYMPDGGILAKQTQSAEYHTVRFQADYTKTFAVKHAVNAIAGYEVRTTFSRTDKTATFGYDDATLSNQMKSLNIASMTGLGSSYGDMYNLCKFRYTTASLFWSNYLSSMFDNQETEHHYYSYYVNGNYMYDKRYSVFFSLRKDYADLFGTDPKFRGKPLYGVGASWNMENESWLKDAGWIDQLKLRYSWGLTGNINSNVSSYLTATMGVNSITSERYATLSTPPYDQLRWEKTRTHNIGLDFAFLRGRIRGSFDWYNKHTSDILANKSLDPSEGFKTVTVNDASVTNKGYELTLSGDIIKARRYGDLNVRLNFTLSHNTNEVTDLNYVASTARGLVKYVAYGSYTVDYKKGYPVNGLWSIIYDGIDEKGQLLFRNAKTGESQPSFMSGNTILKDQDAVVYSGTLDPKYTGSLEPEISWKGVTLSAMFVYYGGHVMRANQPIEYTTHINFYSLPNYLTNCWSPENTETLVPGCGIYHEPNYDQDYLQYADTYVYKADFIKMRNIAISYDLSRKLCNKIGLQHVRLRLQGNNIWKVWTANDQGYDPEAVNPCYGTLTYSATPSATFSVNVNF